MAFRVHEAHIWKTYFFSERLVLNVLIFQIVYRPFLRKPGTAFPITQRYPMRTLCPDTPCSLRSAGLRAGPGQAFKEMKVGFIYFDGEEGWSYAHDQPVFLSTCGPATTSYESVPEGRTPSASSRAWP